MSLAESVGKAIAGDEETAVIRSGTLFVTRSAGVIAAVIIAIAQFEWGLALADSEKLWASVAAVAVWAFLAAADAIARGYATAHSGPYVTALPSPLKAELPGLPSADEKGWNVFLIRTSPHDPDDVSYWVVKGSEAHWKAASEVEFSK